MSLMFDVIILSEISGVLSGVCWASKELKMY